jgi:PAS domain S-box-containing protein
MVTADSNHSRPQPLPQKGTADDRAQLHLRLQYKVAEVLANAGDVQQASAGILATICESFGWQWGAFWIRRDSELRFLNCWGSTDCPGREFEQISRACHFVEGQGMPGQAWAQRKPIWIADFQADHSMPRRLEAERCGLRTAVAVPISGTDVFGVMEFFADRTLQPDNDVLQMLSATGAQIGQFAGRKEMENALAHSQGLFQGIFQCAKDAILLADNHGKLIEANPAAAELLGCTREEIFQKHFWEVVPIGSPERSHGVWAELLTSAGSDGEFTLQRSSGPAIEVEYRITPNVSAGVHMSILRDVTGRKQRERSARLLAATGAILGEGLDFQTTVTRVARVAVPAFADWCILDLLRDDGSIYRAAMAHADQKIEASAREIGGRLPINPARKFGSPNVIRTGQTEFLEISSEVLRQAAGAEYFHLAQTLDLQCAIISPLKRQGRAFGALSFWRTKRRGPFTAGDSELAEELARRAGWALENARLYEAAKQELQLRERAEAELKHLNAELERRIQDRTAALQESHSQMEAFCYSVSHDLRAPLRSMQGFSHALVEDHGQNLNAEGRDFARRILCAAEHMDGLLRDVLAYSRLSRQELNLEPVSVRAVFEDARLHLQDAIQKRKAEVDIAHTEHKALANRAVLELMVANLLDNALKFVPRERTPKVAIECERRENGVRIHVRDNGIGVAPEHQQRIFRIFERLHGVETYPGSGVGLALVQKAAERMGGAVGVQSTLGEGSAFWIELADANSQLTK